MDTKSPSQRALGIRPWGRLLLLPTVRRTGEAESGMEVVAVNGGAVAPAAALQFPLSVFGWARLVIFRNVVDHVDKETH